MSSTVMVNPLIIGSFHGPMSKRELSQDDDINSCRSDATTVKLSNVRTKADIISDDERLLELLEDLSPTVQDRDRLVAVLVGLRACVNGRDRDGVNAVYTVAQTVAPEDAVERLFGLSQSDWGRMDTLIDTRIQEILSERRVLPPQVDVDQGTAQSFSSLSSQGASNGGTTGREAASTGAVVVRRRNENDEDATTARTEPTTETQM